MKRRGMTIIEVTLAVTLAMVVMGTLSIVVSRMLLSNGTAHDHLQDLTTLGRLGEQFRRDAHAARLVAIEDAQKQPLELKLTAEDESTIIYTIVPEGLARVQNAGDRVRSRDLFVLTGIRPLGWKLNEPQTEVTLAMGRVARPREADGELSGQFAIAAALRGKTATQNSPAEAPAPGAAENE